eukprot:1014283-Amphidinium_carterae.3
MPKSIQEVQARNRLGQVRGSNTPPLGYGGPGEETVNPFAKMLQNFGPRTKVAGTTRTVVALDSEAHWRVKLVSLATVVVEAVRSAERTRAQIASEKHSVRRRCRGFGKSKLLWDNESEKFSEDGKRRGARGSEDALNCALPEREVEHNKLNPQGEGSIGRCQHARKFGPA